MKEKFNFSLFIRKAIVLVLGLFILAFGIALSSKSGLGVSPSASLSYVLSLIFPFSMGTFTMFVNIAFVIVQFLVLQEDYKLINLLQLVAVFIFSYFTDLTLAIVAPIEINTYWVQLLLSVVSCPIMALGVYLEVKAGLIVMAAEGAISAIASKSKKLDFGSVKIIMDWGFIIVSCAISLLVFHGLNGVREGSIIAAFLVGFTVRLINVQFRFLGNFLDSFLEIPEGAPEPEQFQIAHHPLVITIEREFGSGGHEIGQAIAKKLGFDFYDYNLIEKTAHEAGLPAEDVRKLDEHFGLGILQQMSHNSYAMSQTESKEDNIFHAQASVIKKLAETGNCVIVGRLSGYILRGRPNTFNLFFSADREARAEYLAKNHGIPTKDLLKMIKREDASRAAYCMHFTGKPWGLATHYSLSLHTSDYGIENATNIVLHAVDEVIKTENMPDFKKALPN